MPDDKLESVLKSIDARRERTLGGLIEFLRIPSVSTKPDHAPHMRHCANWLAERLHAARLKADVRPTGGHPIVLAKNEHRPGRPTVLFYGHYDVQPPEPLDKWTSPPFEPAVRNGAIYARGAVDDKGQVWANVEAVTVWQEAGGLPVNLTMLIEGEEEIGSENLERFVAAHHSELAADVVLVCDTGQFARGVPANHLRPARPGLHRSFPHRSRS